MSSTINRRMTVRFDGDFVVFLIGARINGPWKIHQWLPVAMAMPKMLKELSQKPESGFLGAESSLLLVVQYWRSFEQLKSYAKTLMAFTFLPGKTSTRKLKAVVM